MSNQARIIMPFPPSVNSYWQPVESRRPDGSRHSRMVLTPAAHLYRSVAQVAVMMQRPVRFGKSKLIVELHMHPRRAGSDIDNFKKGLLDGLTHAGVWSDDSQVIKDQTHIRKSIKGGFFVVDIREATPEEIADTTTLEIEKPARGWPWE